MKKWIWIIIAIFVLVLVILLIKGYTCYAALDVTFCKINIFGIDLWKSVKVTQSSNTCADVPSSEVSSCCESDFQTRNAYSPSRDCNGEWRRVESMCLWVCK